MADGGPLSGLQINRAIDTGDVFPRLLPATMYAQNTRTCWHYYFADRWDFGGPGLEWRAPKIFWPKIVSRGRRTRGQGCAWPGKREVCSKCARNVREMCAKCARRNK
jgi:hypothetical protein